MIEFFEVIRKKESTYVHSTYAHKKRDICSKVQMRLFVQYCKTPKIEIFAFLAITLEPIRF